MFRDTFKKFLDMLQANATKVYLVLANIILVIFGIWFSNAGLLPFKNVGDFAFFAALALILALYRPGWTLVFFIGTIALENINLAPKDLGLALRPYQFFGFLTIISLLVQMIAKRLPFMLPKFHWYDALTITFALGGFLSSLGAASRGASFKQSLIALSFIALYFFVRVYIQSFEDLKRVVPFFLSSSAVIVIYGIWQNVRFILGRNSFEVMPGRTNATFTEADWYGIFLVFLLAVILAIIFQQSKKAKISNYFSYFFLVLIFISLILTVSRSAWLGAVIVTIGFLKFVLTNGWLKASKWQWKNWAVQSVVVVVLLVVSLGIAMGLPLTRFQLLSRAQSTGGLQKITIACQPNHAAVPEQIRSVDELGQYGCEHINLEDINSEKVLGNEIIEVQRPDPNVNIRAVIYQKSISQIKTHSIFGIGWGSISSILGTDERGAGLNASNIFLETWLGAGLLGFLSFVILLGYIFVRGIVEFLSKKNTDKTVAALVLLGWAAVVVPNLFNSGIFLGFVWMYLAVAVSLLNEKRI